MKKICPFVFMAVIMVCFCACSANPKTNQDPHPNISHQENDLFATPDNAVLSPSGNYILTIENDFEEDVYTNRFVIYTSDDDTSPVFECEKAYRTRDRLYFLWDELDNIWVYSGDIGTTLWSKDNDVWTDQYPAPDDKPAILQEALNAHS